MEKYGRPGHATDNIILRLRLACWITKATYTYSEYVILIAFPQQQWFLERSSMLRYTYIVSPVCVSEVKPYGLKISPCAFIWSSMTATRRNMKHLQFINTFFNSIHCWYFLSHWHYLLTTGVRTRCAGCAQTHPSLKIWYFATNF